MTKERLSRLNFAVHIAFVVGPPVYLSTPCLVHVTDLLVLYCVAGLLLALCRFFVGV